MDLAVFDFLRQSSCEYMQKMKATCTRAVPFKRN